MFEAGAYVSVKIAPFGTHSECACGFPVPLWLSEGHSWAVDDPMGSFWEQQWPCALLWSRTPSLSYDFCCPSGRAWSAGTGICVQAPTVLLKGLPDATDALKV